MPTEIQTFEVTLTVTLLVTPDIEEFKRNQGSVPSPEDIKLDSIACIKSAILYGQGEGFIHEFDEFSTTLINVETAEVKRI